MKMSLSMMLLVSSFAVGCSLEHEGGDVEVSVQPGGAGEEPASCAADTLCLELDTIGVGDVAAGRLAVVWVQLQTMDPQPKAQIGLDIELDLEAERYSVPFSAIQPPHGDALLLCERQCDADGCACANRSGVATAMVVVAEDANSDGRLTVDEVAEGTFGRGDLLLAHSKSEQVITPPPADQLFADGVARGVAAYRFIGNPEERSARVQRADRGETFDLDVCAIGEEECAPPAPAIRIVQ
jgi:hypothetical protein